MAERVYDCERLYVAQRTVYGGIFLYGLVGAFVGKAFPKNWNTIMIAERYSFWIWIILNRSMTSMDILLEIRSLSIQGRSFRDFLLPEEL